MLLCGTGSGHLYVGGDFTVEGSNVSAFVAAASLAPQIRPPTVVCPTNMSVEFADAAGAVVFFGLTATDPCVGPVPVSSIPASGSTFPIGTNTILCTDPKPTPLRILSL